MKNESCFILDPTLKCVWTHLLVCMMVFFGHSTNKVFLPSWKLQTISLFSPSCCDTHKHNPPHTHPGGQRGGGRGWCAFHAGDDGAVQSAAEGAAATQSHSDRLASVLWQSGADRWPGTVWHRSVQKFHRGECLERKTLPKSCQAYLFSLRLFAVSTGSSQCTVTGTVVKKMRMQIQLQLFMPQNWNVFLYSVHLFSPVCRCGAS